MITLERQNPTPLTNLKYFTSRSSIQYNRATRRYKTSAPNIRSVWTAPWRRCVFIGQFRGDPVASCVCMCVWGELQQLASHFTSETANVSFVNSGSVYVIHRCERQRSKRIQRFCERGEDVCPGWRGMKMTPLLWRLVSVWLAVVYWWVSLISPVWKQYCCFAEKHKIFKLPNSPSKDYPKVNLYIALSG